MTRFSIYIILALTALALIFFSVPAKKLDIAINQEPAGAASSTLPLLAAETVPPTSTATDTPPAKAEAAPGALPTLSMKTIDSRALKEIQQSLNQAQKTLIELEKTQAPPPQQRLTQAELYADGLEQKHGQRPVIFYTNGFDIYIWDDAQKQTPRRLFGFYSKESLKYLIFQRHHKLALDTLTPKSEIAGRMYQVATMRCGCVLRDFWQKQGRARIP